MVVFGIKWLYLGKSDCLREKWLYSDKSGVFDQSGCNWEKVVVFGQKLLYSGKVVVIRQRWFL